MKKFEFPKMNISIFTNEEILTNESLVSPEQPDQLQAIEQFNESSGNSLVGRASFQALMKVK